MKENLKKLNKRFRIFIENNTIYSYSILLELIILLILILIKGTVGLTYLLITIIINIIFIKLGGLEMIKKKKDTNKTNINQPYILNSPNLELYLRFFQFL